MRVLLLGCLLAMGAWAQAGTGPSLQLLSLPSRHLRAPLQAEVHLPAGYASTSPRRYPVCLLLHGGGGTATNLRELGLADLATRHGIIIVAPDAGQALFVDSVGAAEERLETAIMEDLLPEIDRRFRTTGNRQGRMICGLSLGGYAALHFGVLHPGHFAVAASLSGVVEAPRWSAFDELFLPPMIRDQVTRALGPPGSAVRRGKDLFALLNSMSPEARRALPLLTLDCGTEDGFLAANQRFAAHLQRLGIRHEFRPSPGRHDGEFWQRRLEDVLKQGNRILKAD